MNNDAGDYGSDNGRLFPLMGAGTPEQ